MTTRTSRITGAVAVVGAAALLTFGSAAGPELGAVPTTLTSHTSAATPAQADSISSGFVPGASYADVVAEVMPAVVTVRSERQVIPTSGRADDLFERFFGDRFPGPLREGPRGVERGLGSGVIMTPDGYILTNHHVIDGAQSVTVELSDRQRYSATIVGSDPPTDLAVLKIDATNLPVLPVGDSDALRVGDVVLAIGNPLGVGQTVTMGIVSGKNRTTGLSEGAYEDFIQTDAPINQGNSGGALVTAGGELVGINSQILSPSGGNIGIGFAIPASMAQHVMDQLIADGHVSRGRLGIVVQSLSADLAAGLGLEDRQGALVSDVVAGGPADEAGLRQGDVIETLNGRPVSDSNELRNTIAATAPGTSVELTVRRDGQSVDVTATLGEVESRTADRLDGGEPDASGGLGLAVAPISPDDAERLGEVVSGLMVRDVLPGSPAERAGILRGDVIEGANGRDVSSVADLRNAVQGREDRPSVLRIHREGRDLFVAVPTDRV